MLEAGCKALGHVANLMLNGGGNGDFARNCPRRTLDNKINLASGACRVLPRGGISKFPCSAFDTLSNEIVLMAANSFVGWRHGCFWRFRHGL